MQVARFSLLNVELNFQLNFALLIWYLKKANNFILSSNFYFCFMKVKDVCPIMCNSTICNNGCNYDSCLNGGVFNTTTCDCLCPAPYIGKICEIKSNCSSNSTCLNGGIYNWTSCTCNCSPQFKGSLCELTTTCPVTKNCLHSAIL